MPQRARRACHRRLPILEPFARTTNESRASGFLLHAFLKPEAIGLDSDQICKQRVFTPTNLWVILYRARMALRPCLEWTWLARPNQNE